MTPDEKVIVRQLIIALERALIVWHDAPHYPTPEQSQLTAELARKALNAAGDLAV
jgi:hypothetical protein